MSPAFLAELRERKAEVLAILGAESDSAPPLHPETDRGAVEERAAILEYEAGLPRAWAEGAARLLAGLRPPKGYAPWRWAQVCDDTAELIRAGWAAEAAAAGWDAREAFGAMPGYPEARIDAQGLAWLIRGCRVVALEATGADIETADGGRLRFHRRTGEHHPTPSTALWALPTE
jgi:hypothetical protein